MVAHEFLRFEAEALHIDWDRFAELPRSARVTFEAILREGPLSIPQLRHATGLPSRTLRFALQRLRQQEFLDGRRNLQDARTVYYFVHRRRVRPQALDAARVRAEEAASRGQLIEVLEPIHPRNPLERLMRPPRPDGTAHRAP